MFLNIIRNGHLGDLLHAEAAYIHDLRYQMFEEEIHDYYEIPKAYGIVSVIPIGFPVGNFGPVTREPTSKKTHYGKWGLTK